MWEIDINFQLFGFLVSVLLGGSFCILYDILRSLRKSFKFSDFAVFLQDIFYFVLCAPVVFCFLLSLTNGELRAYIFIGIIIGFALIRVTVSHLVFILFNFLFLQISRIYNVIKTYSTKIYVVLSRIFGKLRYVFASFIKKVKNSAKKGLKKQ